MIPSVKNCDYQRHPLYGGHFSPSIVERLRATGSVLRHATNLVLSGEVYQRWPDYSKQYKAVPEAFLEQGLIANAASESTLKKAQQLAQPFVDRIQARRADCASELLTFEHSIEPVNAASAPELIECISNLIFSEIGLGDALHELLGRPPRVTDINVHLNLDTDDAIWKYGAENDKALADVNFFHVDTTRNSVKSMLYLTDTTTESGAFEYVRGSHRWKKGPFDWLIRRAIRVSGYYRRDENSRRAFTALPSCLQRKNDIGSDYLSGDPYLNLLRDNRIVCAGPAGSFILFDPAGIHHGGIVSSGTRIALQIVIQ